MTGAVLSPGTAVWSGARSMLLSSCRRPLSRMRDLMRSRISTAALALALAAPCALVAQQPAPTGPQPPEVGQMAPDFVMSGASRYGVLRDSIRLSDLRGQTVVLAFFVKARTRG